MIKSSSINIRNLALTSLFSAIIFIEKIIVPAPYDKLVSLFVQAALLMLGYLIMDLMGSFYISILSGTLLAFIRAEFALMTLSLSVAYGVLLGLFAKILRVKSEVSIKSRRLIISSTFSSAIVGAISMSVTMILDLIPMNLGLIIVIFIGGLIQGALGGYLAGILWRRYITISS